MHANLKAWVWVAAAAACGGWSVALRAATPGFVADFNNGDIHGFFSQATLAVVPTGGAGGAGDGYLSITRTSPGNLGAASFLPELTGDLIADGVTGFSLWLNDIGADNPLQIHVGLGNIENFWLATAGLSPPEGSWQQFSVDLNESNFVRIIGTGTFNDAISNCTRFLVRHDVPPLVQDPDNLAGNFGLDRITVLPIIAPVPALSKGGLALAALLLAAVAVAVLRPKSSMGDLGLTQE